MNKYIPDTNITYNDFLELDNQLYKIKYEKSKLEKENKQLKDNWNKLKDYIDNQWLDDKGIIIRIKDRIELIENGDSNE